MVSRTNIPPFLKNSGCPCCKYITKKSVPYTVNKRHILQTCRSPGSKATNMLTLGTSSVREDIVASWHLGTRERSLVSSD